MEGTKSEKFTEYEQLIVQVAEIYRMANDEAARVKMLKEADRAAGTAQDAAARAAHKALSEEELHVSAAPKSDAHVPRPLAPHQRELAAITYHVPSALQAAGGGKRRG